MAARGRRGAGALITPRPCHKAEVIVGHTPLTALVGERADRAVRDGLRVGLVARASGHLLQAAGDVAMQRGVAPEVGCDH